MIKLRPFGLPLTAALFCAALAGPAAAQLNLNRQNSNQPIEISSDTLEVQQDKQLAIFRGKVDVQQGDTRLRSDELHVFYRDRNEQTAASAGGARPAQPAARPAATPGAGGADSGSIKKIEAKGNVFVSTPKERAQGEFGVYDVDKKTVTLTGNVLLTSDSNTVRCERVVIYQDTGRNTCDPAAGQRVRGVIIPNNSDSSAPAGQGGQRR